MVNKKIPKMITQDEFEKLFSHVRKLRDKAKTEKAKKKYNHRLIALILGFESGMRISEILGYKKDLSRCCRAELEEKLIKVRETKHKKFYCLKCGEEITRKDFVKSKTEWKIRPLTQEQVEDACIRIIDGKGGKDGVVPRPKRITERQVKELPLLIRRRSFQKFVTKIGEEVLGKHITVHTLRHGFGSHLAGMGRPLHEIQMLMRHSRLDTTGIYLHANPKQAIDGARDVF